MRVFRLVYGLAGSALKDGKASLVQSGARFCRAKAGRTGLHWCALDLQMKPSGSLNEPCWPTCRC